MKKLFLLGLAAAMGFGCAITNYQLIVDNDVDGTVNTNGKAYIKQSFQIATPWPDGTDNIMWFVDQKANGDRVLTNYDFHRNWFTNGSGSDISPFKDDKYCSPDWTGCSVITAQDPEVGDASIFDYTYNLNCPGLRSLVYVFTTTRYVGECGRAKADRITSALNLVNSMQTVPMYGTTWLKTVLNSTNATIIMDNHRGSTQAFSPAGDIPVYVNLGQRRAIIDMQNPVNRQMFEQIRSWANSHPGPYQTVTDVINGESFPSDRKLLVSHLGQFIDQHY